VHYYVSSQLPTHSSVVSTLDDYTGGKSIMQYLCNKERDLVRDRNLKKLKEARFASLFEEERRRKFLILQAKQATDSKQK